ncbi:MAG: hypothetical protein ACQCN6_02025 [Candidatus Bathyarchaeia archaeon]
MKHNISITMDQKLFRELENIRGREKRSTFIEHLIITGLKNYKPPTTNTPIILPPTQINRTQTPNAQKFLYHSNNE